MTQAKVTAPELLRGQGFPGFLKSKGPCITILLAPYRPGEQGRSMATQLKSMLQEVAHLLAAQRVPESAAYELLKPLSDLTEDEELLGGSQFARLILRSEEHFEQFDLPAPVKPLFTVGGYFHIRPVLANLNLPPEFYILKLSKKQVELLNCAELRAQRVALPKGVPETLEKALAFKPPDHDLVNRSFAGGSLGAMPGVRFGTGSGRETQHTYLADFYKMVDRGVVDLLRAGEAPLVLAGVDEDTAAYRSIHTYSNLVSQSLHGSPNGPAPDQELVEQAYALVRSAQIDRTATAVLEWKERFAPARFATELKTILHAATEGRIDKLYIGEDAHETGVLLDIEGTGRWSRGDEDLLNAAAVETMLHGGMAFGLPSNKMPDESAAAAVLRY
jgi:hypothetical protein